MQQDAYVELRSSTPSIPHEPFQINFRLGNAMASIDRVYRQIISHYGLRLFKSDESPPPPPWLP